ncbi:hypothetical protein TEA_013081 [Camellia sinensis var. sinensis]|uniref:Uncharacterized protein n=1 Tax=Camellia sinensis var. sinensis TaxID=542762 RepID=A0A4V3WJK9_CAMSN|nr:hypothetical protein TEA_013081 [Camellia sinensis var. sinensis]
MLVDRKNMRLGPTSKPNGKSMQRPTYHNHRPRNGNHTSTSDLGPSSKVSMPNQIPPKQVGRKRNMQDKKSHRPSEGQSIDMMRRGNEFTSNAFDCLQPCATNTEITTPSVIAAECIDGSVNLITSPTLAPSTPAPPHLNCVSTNATNSPSSTITIVTTPNPQPAPTISFDHGAPGEEASKSQPSDQFNTGHGERPHSSKALPFHSSQSTFTSKTRGSEPPVLHQNQLQSTDNMIIESSRGQTNGGGHEIVRAKRGANGGSTILTQPRNNHSGASPSLLVKNPFPTLLEHVSTALLLSIFFF